ncbi:MAG: PIN domain-containing protein [Betaproteobacteria bacterium]|nr:PIN domain-containing protein [Betaproteobacteria bacterium]
MTALVFVDTNVLVYARDAAQRAKQPLAADWVARLWREQTGRISMQVLSEYYVTVTRKLEPGLKQADAWDDVRALLSWDPQPIDTTLIQRAREIEQRHRLAWWDSLIVGAAQLQNCTVLLSEDLQDGGAYGGVTVRSPFTFAINEPAAAYPAPPVVARSHPPRGRPASRRASGLPR